MRRHYAIALLVLAVTLLAGAAFALTNPVTGLTATPQGALANVSCKIDFTLPADLDVVGARVVVNGSNDPANVGDGVVVADVAGSPGGACTATYTVPIAQRGRVFWYRVWTYDSGSNYCSVSAGVRARMLNGVVIQDTTTGGSGTAVWDSPLRGDWNDCNIGQNGTDRQWRMFPDSNTTALRHNLMKVDVSGIPSDTTIAAANLGIYIARYGGTVPDVTGYKISRLQPGKDWLEGTNDYQRPALAGDVTWDMRKQGSVAWQTPGATGAADIDLTTSISWDQTGGNATVGWKAFDLTLFAQHWVDGTWENNGILFWGGSGGDPSNGKYNWGYLSESPLANAARPFMTVLWVDKTPTVAAPTGDAVVLTLTPTVTWLSNAGATVINHQVRICTTDDPSAAVAKDSGTVAGNALSWVCPTNLANLTQYYTFVREETAGGWVGWSATGAGGFHTAVTEPATPVITLPTGTISNPKPSILFPGADAHISLRMKVFTSNVGNPETATAYFDSTVLASAANSCVSGLLENGSYWAFVKIENAIGWSTWSAGKSFTVLRDDWVDVLHMDETVPDLLNWNNPGGTDAWTGTVLTNPSRQDGFHEILADQGTHHVWSIADETGACGAVSSNKVLIVANDSGNGTRSLRMHKCQDEIDLDRGVTFMWEMACQNEVKGTLWNGKTHVCGTVYLGDKDPYGAWHRVSVRCRADSVGIVSDQYYALLAGSSGGQDGPGFTNAALPFSEGFRRYRLTGRNQTAGNYNSAKWDLYVDDVWKVGSTGTFSDAESDPPYQRDFVAVGIGEMNLNGEWIFDWVGINGGGDYGPGEWDPVPAGASSFTSIGAAKKAVVGNRAVTVDGSMVITKVVTHVDAGPDLTLGTEDDFTVQDCYFVQDLTSNLLGAGVKVITSDTQTGTVAAGAQVTHLAGVMSESGGCRSIGNPTVTIEGSTTVQATAMSQKTVMGPCVEQNLGSNMDTTGMLVRVFGRVPTAAGYLEDDPVNFPLGYFVVYVDDGSGATDGRDLADGLPVAGIRVTIDAADPFAVVPSFGDYVMMEGIAGYQAITGGSYGNARQIMYPSITVLASGV